MSQSESFDVVFEPFPGGRIYEKAADGSEHDWGQVTLWEPPHRLEYLWHIFLEPALATKVTVSFEEVELITVVRLENSGFEIFGDIAAERRDRVSTAWVGITDRFQQSAS